VRKPGEGDLDTGASCRGMLRGLCCQGERGFVLLKERRRGGHVTVGPARIGGIVKAALVLAQIGHKMIA
jgi:hypothetical protein